MDTIDKNHTWSFPDMEYLSEGGAVASQLKFEIKKLENRINELTNELNLKNKEIEQQRIFMEAVNAKQSEQQVSFDKCLEKLTGSLPQLNNDHILLVTNVVKMLVKKIIYKELDKDDKIIKKMLSDLLEQINQEGSLTVEVSQKDFSILSQSKLAKNIKLIMREGLQPGDITVLAESSAYVQRIGQMIDTIVSK